VVDTLDKQLQRQAGGIVDTDTVAPPVAHPLAVIAPECAPVELNYWVRAGMGFLHSGASTGKGGRSPASRPIGLPGGRWSALQPRRRYSIRRGSPRR
jgi:hypothetical protein